MADVIACFCDKGQAAHNAEEVEALAVKCGLEIAKDIGVTKVVVESDCQQVISKLKNGTIDRSYEGFIISDILSLVNFFNVISFKYVRRICNGVAHCLAKCSHSFDGFRVWMEEVPPEVNLLVAKDLLA